MHEKFQNKYRISSSRLQTWNYASEGIYFITINTKNRIRFFGQIDDGKMQLSELGRIVEDEWLKTPIIRPDMNLVLGEFVVMPDHFHAVLSIGQNTYNQLDPIFRGNIFSAQSNNLPSIIRGFKSAVTTNARKLETITKNPKSLVFEWQPRYHDHVIRNADEYYRISQYIRNNPSNWHQ
ncbi:MAG: hypothetical protein KDC49_06890 [Saprospiraceae bacterium]|nr:hypothetical protein [Saprospiraceae bacterium]